MSLHQLPPELLLDILGLLGSAFFRQDVRRLLVSKWWYQLAWPVFLQDLEFHAESLERFILAFERPGMLRSIHEYVKTASLVLDGFEDWDSALPATGPLEIDFKVVHTWTFELNTYVAALAGILQQCPRLRLLRLEARPERHPPRLGLLRRDYLVQLPVASLVSIGQLTCLEIDTAGTNLAHGSPASGVHLCTIINTMLPALRRLRCRMSSICPAIFKVPERGSLPKLEEVIINLSLSDPRGSDTSYRYPNRCGFLPGDNFPRLKADIETSAREFVLIINKPRMIRILSHTFPGLDLHSLDVLTDRRMVLAPAAPWDADGEALVEEVDSGQDSFDSDSSSEEFLV